MKALIVAFYQENATVGAFSVIVKTDGWFAALFVTLARRRARVPRPGACTTLLMSSQTRDNAQRSTSN